MLNGSPIAADITSQITLTNHGEALVISPVGEFDISSVDQLHSVFKEAATSRNHQIVVDMTQLTFIDSMALGTIIRGARRANDAGGWLRLVAPQPAVLKVLQLTELDKVFGIFDSAAEAVAAV